MSEAPKETLLKYDVPVCAGTSTMRKAKPLSEAAEPLTRDVLNSILPPREFSEEGQDLIQYVSTAPATRLDVIKLQRDLDTLLEQRKARSNGICPVRSELYGQCFDEIIRQIAIDCPARGLLLVRVRDELRTTVAAYQALYESAINWGMKKATHVEEGKEDLEAENAQLREKKRQLELRGIELQAKIEAIQKREEDYRHQREKEYADETAFLKRQTAQLKAQLEQMLTNK